MTTSGGSANRNAKFTAGQNIENGSISDQYASGVALTINASGNLVGIGTLTGLTGLTSSGTITFSALGSGIAHLSSGGVLSSSAVNLAGSDVTGTLPVANGGTGGTTAGTARTNLGAAASGANSDITSLSGLTTALSVGQGGTGVTSLTSNGVLYGGATVGVTGAGTSGQLLVANGSGVPAFVSLSGDATMVSTGVLTLGNSGVGAATYGSASQVPVFAVDVKGRVTSVTNTAIAIAASAITSGTLPVARGGTNATTIGSAGGVAYSNGSSYAFSSVGSNGQVLTSAGSGTPVWSDANLSGFWDRDNGALSPKIAGVHDLLIGSNSTESAKFAFINVNSGTPVASIAGNLTLNSAGVISSTRNQTLTLGSSQTGNIIIDSGSGLITLSDPSTFSSTLTLNNDAISDFTGSGLALSTGALGIKLDTIGGGSDTESKSGLTLTSNGLSLLESCGSGQILKWNGTNWVCSADDGSGTGSSKWTETGSEYVYPDTISNRLGVGTQTTGDIISSAYFTRNQASGATGKALAVFNQTENEDIFTASASGDPKFSITNNGNLTFKGGTNIMSTLTSAATDARTYTFPDESGTVCLTSGNCDGSGGSITGSGTTNYLPKFTNTSVVGISSIFDNGKVGIGTIDPTSLLHLSGAITGKALAIFDETGDQDIFTASASGAPVFTISRNGNLAATGALTGLTGLTVASGTVSLPAGQIGNTGTCQFIPHRNSRNRSLRRRSCFPGRLSHAE